MLALPRWASASAALPTSRARSQPSPAAPGAFSERRRAGDAGVASFGAQDRGAQGKGRRRVNQASNRRGHGPGRACVSCGWQKRQPHCKTQAASRVASGSAALREEWQPALVPPTAAPSVAQGSQPRWHVAGGRARVTLLPGSPNHRILMVLAIRLCDLLGAGWLWTRCEPAGARRNDHLNPGDSPASRCAAPTKLCARLPRL